MILNGQLLLDAAPLRGMVREKRREHGVSYGLAEAGYDIRIKQEVIFRPHLGGFQALVDGLAVDAKGDRIGERFALASAIEEFQMPDHLVGVVHDKSTWARKRLSVLNTVIEPGWRGFLTLELVYHGHDHLVIPAGAGIAQILFHELHTPAAYTGKYQHQEDRPVEARHE